MISALQPASWLGLALNADGSVLVATSETSLLFSFLASGLITLLEW